MGASIEDRVFAFVAKETGFNRNKLSPTKTLGYDLGLDGADALEFFSTFKKEFELDLQDLYVHWDSYFGPEGVTLGTALAVAIPASLLALTVIRLLPRFPAWLCFLLGFSVWMGCLHWWSRWRGDRRPQITIQDLVDAAVEGKLTLRNPRPLSE